MVYKLLIPDNAPPMAQKERKFAQQRQQIIRDNVQELLLAEIIKRIDYLVWFANPVVVPKHSGSDVYVLITQI